jgi:hypothetical protein
MSCYTEQVINLKLLLKISDCKDLRQFRISRKYRLDTVVTTRNSSIYQKIVIDEKDDRSTVMMSGVNHGAGTGLKVRWVTTLILFVFLSSPLQVETAFPFYTYFLPCLFSICCTSRQIPTQIIINLNLPRTSLRDIVEISLDGGSFLGESDNLKDNICRWRVTYSSRSELSWAVSGICSTGTGSRPAPRLSAKVVINNPTQEAITIIYSTRRLNSTEGLVIPLGSMSCSVPSKKICQPCLTSRPYMAVVTDGSRTTCQSAPTYTINTETQYINPRCSEFRPSTFCRPCTAPPSDDDL